MTEAVGPDRDGVREAASVPSEPHGARADAAENVRSVPVVAETTGPELPAVSAPSAQHSALPEEHQVAIAEETVAANPHQAYAPTPNPAHVPAAAPAVRPQTYVVETPSPELPAVAAPSSQHSSLPEEHQVAIAEETVAANPHQAYAPTPTPAQVMPVAPQTHVVETASPELPAVATPSPRHSALPEDHQAARADEHQPQSGHQTPVASRPSAAGHPAAAFGRVTDDGTVYVLTPEGERQVGQIPDVPPEEALAFFVRRFEALEVEVGLLESRLRRGALSAEDGRRAVQTARRNITEANCVGDLAGLSARLDALTPVMAEAQEARKAERAKANEATKAAKEEMVAEAEKLAAGNDWRGGVNRFRALLDQWKALPRIDRVTDDELWHRFSTSRTTYTRRRKAQMSEQNEKRDSARQAKEAIIGEARTLASSSEWGAAAGGFRDLMTRWKAAGVAARDVDDKLWAEFRGIQDDFFARRTQAQTEQDAEFSGNLEAKQALLDEAEKTILPVKDPKAARSQFRTFLQQYNEHGKVPRDSIRPLEGRVRAIEDAIRKAEDAEWKRTDPETMERASGTANLLADQIAKLKDQLAKAEAKGDKKAAAQAEASIATYQSWLDQANATLKDITR